MATSGGQLGNQNAVNAKRWREAILRALARATNKDIDAGLDRAADMLVVKAFEGEEWAISHMADRIDGKAPQGITLSGDADNPLRTHRVIEYVRHHSAKPNGSAEVPAAGETGTPGRTP